MSYTPEQEQAVRARGRTIVSASAGSGKTFVMIGKLVSLILTEAEITDILAVTFTVKAATQMREKLKKALLERLADKSLPEGERLSLGRKLSMLPQADISTIHSFCLRTIKRYFYLLDLPSDFTVLADPAEVAALQGRAMDKLFEACYESGDREFSRLLAVYRKKRGDTFLRETILSFYEKIRPIAGYRELLFSQGNRFEEIKERIASLYQERLCRRERILEELKGQCLDMPTAEGYAEALLLWIRAAKGDYETLRAQTAEPLPRKPRKTKKMSEAEGELIDRMAKVRDALSALSKKTAEFAPTEIERVHFEQAEDIARALVSCTLRFDDLYAEEKRKRARLDYGDLEHNTLKLLSMEGVRKELQARYRYVFVDEYQDVNPVQEAILSAVESDQVFLVGDMKQSIYGFRGGKSVYFAQKIQEYEKGDNALYLKSNFRSAPAILDFVNRVFSVCMKKETGIDYAATSLMQEGGGYEGGTGRVKIHIPLADEEETTIQARGVYSVEQNYRRMEKQPSPTAKLLERIIKDELGSKFYDLDRRAYRTANYGDIAIFVRSKGEELAEAAYYLSSRGIPVAIPGEVNLCAYTEVAGLIDWLSYLDNAEQDIPLASALLSAKGGFSEDELAKIRLRFRELAFRDACKKYATLKGELAERLKAFFAYAEKLRALSRVMSAGEVLSKLIADSRLETELLSYPNGKQKCKRVQKLVDEGTGTIREFMAALKASGNKIPFSEAPGENAVQILTVHASKGLEYPVVILLDVDKKFHNPDNDEVLFFEGLPAPKYYDAEQMIKGETLLRRLCKETQRAETVRDEMNLFYVALTRAKFSLHLVLEKKGHFDESMVAEASSWADFFDPDRFEPEERREIALPFTPAQAILGGEEGDERPILKAMDFSYPYPKATSLPVKTSASAILNKDEEYYMTPSVFGESDREKGTIYHKFLELVDFSKPVEKEYERLQSAFSEEEYARLELPKLKGILSMPIFSRLKGCTLKREQKFLCYLPSEEGEQVLYQGAIDLLAIGKEILIVDYKFTGKGDREVLAHYTPQLLLYKDAVAKILNVPKDKIKAVIVNLLAERELPIIDEK
ncbi:MAG: UvrD-helicase domain-containing protein [Clostridia bacterium]|nr:UvrD-helicase domain-containing protein [Clostridia bacterium]